MDTSKGTDALVEINNFFKGTVYKWMWKLAIYNQKSKMHLSWCTISVSKLIKLEIRVLKLVRMCHPGP